MSLEDIAVVLVEGAVDFFSGRPRDRNPYVSEFEPDSAWAWLAGFDEAQIQLEERGREEAARWLTEAA